MWVREHELSSARSPPKKMSLRNVHGKYVLCLHHGIHLKTLNLLARCRGQTCYFLRSQISHHWINSNIVILHKCKESRDVDRLLRNEQEDFENIQSQGDAEIDIENFVYKIK